MLRKYGIKQEWFSEFFNTKTYAKNFDSMKQMDGWGEGWAWTKRSKTFWSYQFWNEMKYNGMEWNEKFFIIVAQQFW